MPSELAEARGLQAQHEVSCRAAAALSLAPWLCRTLPHFVASSLPPSLRLSPPPPPPPPP
eukprot:SAG11_NODE_24957_length_365_cov_1.349624_1_plen_59_part_01